jgi:predicted alpha-1,6-mannanase (GH76 family)
MRFHLTALFVLVSFVLPGLAQTQAKRSQTADRSQHVEATARVLAETYDENTGLFRGTGWWNSANGISALVEAARVLHTTEFDAIFQTTFSAAQHQASGFRNEFYDDEGWWALAWLDVYDLRGDRRNLEMSKSIFDDMTTGWSDTCGGGIWWKKNVRYKNAIANELFLSVAVRLAAATSGQDRARYLDWAQKEERWFVNSGMINDQGLINDGLDSACHNNHATTWTYNQGVVLSGLSGLSKLTHDPAPLQLASHIAAAVGRQLVDTHGVLHDPCESDCGGDGVQFKGILVRNLVTLQQAHPSPEIVTLLDQNAESLWRNARTENGHFSVNWAGPPQDSGTGSLISALDALAAQVLVEQSKRR